MCMHHGYSLKGLTLCKQMKHSIETQKSAKDELSKLISTSNGTGKCLHACVLCVCVCVCVHACDVYLIIKCNTISQTNYQNHP